jgi:hypothetical protein
MVLPLLEVDFPEPTQGATEISAYRAGKVGFDLMTGSIQVFCLLSKRFMQSTWASIV